MLLFWNDEIAGCSLCVRTCARALSGAPQQTRSGEEVRVAAFCAVPLFRLELQTIVLAKNKAGTQRQQAQNGHFWPLWEATWVKRRWLGRFELGTFVWLCACPPPGSKVRRLKVGMNIKKALFLLVKAKPLRWPSLLALGSRGQKWWFIRWLNETDF